MAWYFTRYAIWRAGGLAIRVTPSRPCDMENLAGLVLGGGADVAPELYGAPGEPVIEEIRRERNLFRSVLTLLSYPFLFLLRRLFTIKVSKYGDPARDRLEQSLLQQALRLKRPVLGICRGAQLINVVLGGTLHQDIRSFYVETPHITTVFPKKRVEILPGTRLAGILKNRYCLVNALHYQAIRELGRDLQIGACEQQPRLIQAIEHKKRFLIGVQWHPEYLFREQAQRSLFQHLVQAARDSIQSPKT